MSIITVPFSMILKYLSLWLNSYGLALMVFALVVALIRLPFDIQSKRSNLKTSLLQPKIKVLQEKYASNQQKLQAEMQKLYQEEDVKPMGGCVWTLIPLVIVLILWSIIRNPLTHMMGLGDEQILLLQTTLEGMGHVFDDTGAYFQVELASYIHDNYEALHAVVPEIFDLNLNFLSMNLGNIPSWNFFMQDNWNAQDVGLFCLPIISTILSYVSQRVTTATSYQQDAMAQQGSMRMMMMLMPLMSLWIGFIFPAAMSIYWISNSLYQTIANVFVNRHFRKIYEEMKADMEERDRQKEAELEAKRKETERLRALNATKENKSTSKKKKQAAERERARQRQAMARKKDGDDEGEYNPSRVGHRKYARGRAYDPDRFGSYNESEEENVIPELEDVPGQEPVQLIEDTAEADENSSEDMSQYNAYAEDDEDFDAQEEDDEDEPSGDEQ